MAKHVIDTWARSSAPPSVVFALLADGRSWPEWGAWTTFELESPSPGFVAAPSAGGTAAGAASAEGPGAVRVFTSRAMGRTTVSRERVLEVVPDRRIAYALLSGLPLRDYVGLVELVPDGDGTVVHWHSEFDGARVGSGLLYRFVLQRFIADAARRVARHAERADRGVAG